MSLSPPSDSQKGSTPQARRCLYVFRYVVLLFVCVLCMHVCMCISYVGTFVSLYVCTCVSMYVDACMQVV